MDEPTPRPHFLPRGARAGEYVIDGLLAEGGFGAVYRAAHAAHGTPAAVKVLQPELASRPDVVLRFEREIEAIQRIGHPNVVKVFDGGRLADGRPYFAMELLAGESLEQHLANRGRLSPEEARAILTPLSSALDAAHARAIVHRDLKASNVFLSEQDGGLRVVLLDFGVAKLLDAPGPALTSSRSVVGTFACISPEQLLGEPVDPRTDVYALGVLAYRMLVGEPPFDSQAFPVLRQLHLHVSPPPPSARARVSPAFDDVILQALRKDRAARQPSVAAFLAAFGAAVEAARGTGAGALAGARSSRALAVYAEAHAVESALDDPEDDLLTDLHDILPFVAAELTKAGLSLAVQTGSSLLFTLGRPDEPGLDEEARRRTLDTVLSVHRALQRRPGRDARIHVRMCVHAGEILVSSEGELLGGGLAEVAAWVPDDMEDGVFASPAVLASPGVAPQPGGAGALLRISDA